MKLETFFEKFEQLTDAPGAVGKMRDEDCLQSAFVEEHYRKQFTSALSQAL